MAAHGHLIAENFTLTPNTKLGFKLWNLQGFQPRRAREILTPPSAIAALPEDQLRTRGFGPITHRPTDFALARWTTAPQSVLTFDSPLDAGSYRLQLAGFRDAEASPNLTQLRLTTAADRELLRVSLGPGAFDLETTITLTPKEAAAGALILTHPLWTSATPDAIHEGVRKVGVRFVRCLLAETPPQ